MNTAEIVKCIDEILKSYGFMKRKYTWYKHFDETTVVFNLQKSDYGGQYYVNLAVGVNALLDNRFPAEEFCHLRMRLDGLIENTGNVLPEFDLENQSINAKERCKRIGKLTDIGAEWLLKFSTVAAIEEALRASQDLRCHAYVVLKEYLHIDPDD